jgi:hypothetical protein
VVLLHRPGSRGDSKRHERSDGSRQARPAVRRSHYATTAWQAQPTPAVTATTAWQARAQPQM